ncbi:MAG: flagellar hook-basal body complex protein FliE [Candidatus Thorarchaeota archaeon]|nr:flagellar hook-basal body complex protein FliE [Candidatus Thorarchaeota archaeon]
MKLIVVTGMPGAGKSEVADTFRSADVPVIVMGDVIREEVRRRGLKPDPVNTKKVMLELREENGPGAVAMQCIDDLKQTTAELVVVEGCRSVAEIQVFDGFVERVITVCVHASPATRFARLRARNRDDDPREWSVFKERDIREISVGLGGVIALSDIMLVNEGTVDELHELSQNVVKRFL